MTLTITEEQRQVVLLALAILSVQRPGWHHMLGEIAEKCSTAAGPTIEDGRMLFEQFRRLYANREGDCHD